MSDTAPRNATCTSRLLADALLRSAAGTAALLRVSASNTDSNRYEMGLAATAFGDVAISPAVLRKMRPAWQEGGESQWELLLSATSVALQVSAMELSSAQALFAMTVAVIIDGQSYNIESVAANEAFGKIYLYRLLLREAKTQAV